MELYNRIVLRIHRSCLMQNPHQDTHLLLRSNSPSDEAVFDHLSLEDSYGIQLVRARGRFLPSGHLITFSLYPLLQ